MNKRILTLAVAVVLGGALLSCGSAAGTSGSETAPTTDTSTAEPEETVSLDEQKKDDYFAALAQRDGTDPEIMFATYNVGEEMLTMNEIGTDSENGSQFNDAVYHRNLEITERTGLVISYVGYDAESDLLSAVRNDVLSGTGFYDVIDATTTSAASLFNSGYLADLDDFANLQLDEPWWNKDANDGFTIAGERFVLLSDVNYYADSVAWFVMFNEYLLDEFDLEDPYELVRSGQWTVDVMLEMMKTLPLDSNGNGETDSDDLYGCVGQYFDANALMTGFGISTFEKDADDIPQFTLNSEKSVDRFTKAYDFFSDSARMWVAEKMQGKIDDCWGTWGSKIARDEALFMFNCAANLSTYLEMEHDFGIVPMPKYDEAQDGYYTMTSIWFTTCLTVPKSHGATVNDIGLAMETMSFLTYTDVSPVYTTTYLNNRFIRDEDSVEMLNLVIAGKKYDPGFVFNWNSSILLPQTAVQSNSNTFASKVEKARSGIEKLVEKTVEAAKSMN